MGSGIGDDAVDREEVGWRGSLVIAVMMLVDCTICQAEYGGYSCNYTCELNPRLSTAIANGWYAVSSSYNSYMHQCSIGLLVNVMSSQRGSTQIFQY